MSSNPEQSLRPFDQLMQEAQVAYGEQRMEDAKALYTGAYDISKKTTVTDWTDTTRAARGVFESTYRIDPDHDELEGWRRSTMGALDNTVALIAGTSEWTFDGLQRAGPDIVVGHWPALRELAQTSTVVGKIGLKKLVQTELMNGEVDEEDRAKVLYSLRASERLLSVAEIDRTTDQYRINWECPGFFGERLYGLNGNALRTAFDAARHARLSESPALPTSANISEAHRKQSRRRAQLRAIAACGSMVLPRAAALRVASKVL